LQSARRIQIQHIYRCSPGRCLSPDDEADKLKVFVPIVGARIEQWLDLSSLVIDAGNVRAFVEIASVAGKG
jgi:hypothetical protein